MTYQLLGRRKLPSAGIGVRSRGYTAPSCESRCAFRRRTLLYETDAGKSRTSVYSTGGACCTDSVLRDPSVISIRLSASTRGITTYTSVATNTALTGLDLRKLYELLPSRRLRRIQLMEPSQPLHLDSLCTIEIRTRLSTELAPNYTTPFRPLLAAPRLLALRGNSKFSTTLSSVIH